ncbi:MAG: RDD family protein [Acidimicrobiales bacterium]
MTPASMLAPFLASFVPFVAFLVAAAAAEESPGAEWLGATSFVLYIAVGLPSWAAVAAARSGLIRLAVTALLTVVAAGSAVAAATSDDAQAGLNVFWVPLVAFPLATVLWIGQKGVDRRATASDADAGRPASTSDRLAAVVVDMVILGAGLTVPLTALSHAHLEVVALFAGIGAGVLYMAVLVVLRQQTIGQRLLGLAVVDAETLGPCPPGRAFVRSLIVVVEATLALSMLAPVAIAEIVAVQATGRSLSDRLLGTAVITVAGPGGIP